MSPECVSSISGLTPPCQTLEIADAVAANLGIVCWTPNHITSDSNLNNRIGNMTRANDGHQCIPHCVLPGLCDGTQRCKFETGSAQCCCICEDAIPHYNVNAADLVAPDTAASMPHRVKHWLCHFNQNQCDSVSSLVAEWLQINGNETWGTRRSLH